MKKQYLYSDSFIEGTRRKILNFTSGAKIEGKSFDSVFQIDSVPLWWFYCRFITRSLLPCISGLKKICSGKRVSNFYFLKLFAIKKFFLLFEWLKIILNKKSIPIKKNSVIFLTYTAHQKGDSIYRIQPLLDSISESTAMGVFPFMNLPKRIKKIPSIYGYVTYDIRNEAWKIAVSLNRIWKQEGRNSLKTNPLWPLISEHCDLLFSKEFLYITFLYHLSVRNLIKQEMPKLFCITANVGLVEKCIITAGNSEKIPVLHIPHGVETDFIFTDVKKFDYLHIAAFGKMNKKIICEAGIPASRVHVTGCPSFDDIACHTSHTSIKAQKAQSDKNNREKKLLFLSQPMVEDKIWTKHQRDIFLKELKNLFFQLGGEIIIKLHPRENASTYALFNNAKIIKDDLYKNIIASDVIIGIYSTAISEAVALNKPVIILDLFGDAKERPIAESGVALYASSAEEAALRFTEFIDYFNSEEFSRKKEKYIEDIFYRIDGNAKKRVAELIRTLSFKNLKIQK